MLDEKDAVKERWAEYFMLFGSLFNCIIYFQK